LVNFTGKAKRAIAVNGQIPMPTLVFTEGDTAEIYVHNLLKEETSLHWHGLFLPNKEDGVPNLRKCQSSQILHIFTVFQLFKMEHIGITVIQGLQEQIGMYGNFVMLKKRMMIKHLEKELMIYQPFPLF
jgi:FtsP/CotA-like multicopper oxidase with cupredoxin domain